MKIAHERNRFDQLTLVYYALVLDQLGRFQDAAAIHLKAIEHAGARENKYGALGSMSMHLYLRGERLRQGRQPEAALGYFLRSREYLEESRRRNFQFGGNSDYRTRKGLLDRLIQLLQDARVEAVVPLDVPPPGEAP